MGLMNGRLALTTPMVTSALVHRPGATFVYVISVWLISLREARRNALMTTTLQEFRRQFSECMEAVLTPHQSIKPKLAPNASVRTLLVSLLLAAAALAI